MLMKGHQDACQITDSVALIAFALSSAFVPALTALIVFILSVALRTLPDSTLGPAVDAVRDRALP